MACVFFFCLTPALSDLVTEKAKEAQIDRVLVEKLIAQLSDRDYAVRDASCQALRQRGAPVLPLLLHARTRGDIETRRRLDELIPEMQSALLLAPQRVTLPKNKSAKEYAALMAAQTKYVIQADGLDGTKLLDLSCSRAPFWETLDRLCDSAGCGIGQNMNEDAIRLVPQSVESPYRAYDGIFRVTATGFNYTRSTGFAQLPKRGFQLNQASEMLMLNLIVHVEPKMPVLKTGRVRILFAQDEEKRSMTTSADGQDQQWQMGMTYYNGFNRSHLATVSAPLVLPSKSSRLVSRIKGVVPLTLLAEQKPLIVTDTILQAKGKKFKVGDATFQIDDVDVTKGKIQNCSIKLTYNENTNETRYDYSKIQSLQQRLEIRDAKGVKITTYPSFLQFNSATSAQIMLKTQGTSDKNAPVPAQLVYIDWAQLDHEVVFDLKDLPLP
jgi:hypothetical protein